MYGGYAYTKKIEKKNRQRSECCQRKTENCKAAVTILSTYANLRSVWGNVLRLGFRGGKTSREMSGWDMSRGNVQRICPGICPRDMFRGYVQGKCPGDMSRGYVQGICPGICSEDMSRGYVQGYVHRICSGICSGDMSRVYVKGKASDRLRGVSHVIAYCTNASRGLSATAEFLVNGC